MDKNAKAGADWKPSAPLEALEYRARLLAELRTYFAEESVLEVQTPALSGAAVSDVHIHSLSTQLSGRTRLHLHTSPEYPMKRLIAAGSGDIYQACTVFRDGESGRRHNPEFTLVEWYRVGMHYRRLMQDTAALITRLISQSRKLEDPVFLSYREAFISGAGVDPLTAGEHELEKVLEFTDATSVSGDRSALLDLVLADKVPGSFGRDRLTAVYDYPANQAALAKVRDDTPPVAERFEIFCGPLELANGYQELTDAAEQRARFEADLAERTRRGLPVEPLDERLLAALEHGLPECAGVAMGLDRVIMAARRCETIDDVMAFPLGRA